MRRSSLEWPILRYNSSTSQSFRRKGRNGISQQSTLVRGLIQGCHSGRSKQGRVLWAAIRDFNCVLKMDEQSSSGGFSSSFGNWDEEEGLIDLGFLVPTSRGITVQQLRLGDWHISTEAFAMSSGEEAFLTQGSNV